MFDTVNRKKDIYDKRPEDHPQYPDEWRLFWEKRYKELQSQGKDADNYDYKPDWIPYWAKRAEELYREEIRVKALDLMQKYGLKSELEPTREEFASSSGGRSNRDDSDRPGTMRKICTLLQKVVSILKNSQIHLCHLEAIKLCLKLKISRFYT